MLTTSESMAPSETICTGLSRPTRIGHRDPPPAGEDHRDADDAMAGLRVDHPADVVEDDGIVAADAGDHRVGVAERHHARAEMVAVGVDEPLHVAEQVALPLQPRVK